MDTFYTRDPVLEVEDGVLQAVTHIHTTKPTGDILVFLDGQETIESLKKILRSKAKMEQWDMRVLPLYSALNPKEQMKGTHSDSTRTPLTSISPFVVTIKCFE